MDGQEELNERRTSLRSTVIPLVIVVATVLCLPIDLPTANFFKGGSSPRWFSELLENAEPFGHGMGTALILAGVFILDRQARCLLPSLVAGSLGAGFTANLVKLTIVRVRPRTLEVLPDSVWSTFGGFFSKSPGNGHQSFPSAHTATAVGLAVMLSAIYPRGRWYFAILALLVAMQRVNTSAHFPSDVCAGALVGWSVASLCLMLTPCMRCDAETEEVVSPTT